MTQLWNNYRHSYTFWISSGFPHLPIPGCMECRSQDIAIEFSAYQISYLGSFSNGGLTVPITNLNFPLVLRNFFIDWDHSIKFLPYNFDMEIWWVGFSVYGCFGIETSYCWRGVGGLRGFRHGWRRIWPWELNEKRRFRRK